MLLPTICPGCGRSTAGRCESCWVGVGPAPEHQPAALPHEGVGRRLVLGLKYRNARPVVAALADHMVAVLDDATAIDVVTWAPTSARRIADRGYDPAELLARAVARRLRKPCRRLLRRSRRSGPQAGKNRELRLAGPQFTARPTWRRQRILVVDDVTTTGATLQRAAEALVAAGAAEVRCLAATGAPGAPSARQLRQNPDR